ncbi:3-oxoacyl-[acyl-carrier-protein] synthase III [Gordonia effusa NBRC 100432]|uniref:3-oxoacyl-[acyl-carrier-protein] synthase III n=1 Tax=Gordonia effusa NBRC 100432 TaxID=1077974 RepID=H0R4S3_9ACTN|nr:ketoacyl-ACP synthase III [Gordonia effusa]GAB20074.1 3-oxoacyl-[acyl-carrier-protein] synthase III [Gordonia effusa NBRC 100432]
MLHSANVGEGPAYGIIGMGMHLPEGVVSNDVVAAAAGVTPEWIVEKTGVEERRRAGENETAAGMASVALRKAIDDAKARNGVDADPAMLIAATSTPDRVVPAPAFDIHGLSELPQIPTLSIDGACAGVAQGMITALGFYRAGIADTSIVVGTNRSEVYFDPADRKTAALFGDGAGAFMLGPVPEGYGILGMRMLTDSVHREAVHVSDVVSPTNGRKFNMNGRQLVEMFVNELPKMIYEALGEAGLTLADVDRLMIHQGNVRMVEAFTALLGLDSSQVPTTGRVVANTACASLPITAVLSDRERPLKRGDIVVMATAGAGVNGAVIVLRWY